MSTTLSRTATAAILAMLAIAPVGVVTSSAAFAKDTMARCGKYADKWKAAYNAKDAEALAGMYDPRTGIHSNEFWTAAGHDGLVQGFKQELMAGNTMTSITCDASSQTGDIGSSSGKWSATAKGPDGKDTTIGGHWLITYEDHQGKVLIVDDTTNMQLPPPR